MTHPHQLHATANLWALRRSWPHLQRAQAAAVAADAESGDAGTLQAWRAGSGRMAASYDGILTAVLNRPAAATATHYGRIMERAREHVFQAYWLAVSDLGRGLDGHGQLARVAAAIAHVRPATARDIAAELAVADMAIRRALQLLPDQWPLPTSPPCPCCGMRMLRVQVANPDSAAWTVVCTAGCRCVGEACRCGMIVQEQGVAHIWDRSAAFVVEELARMPRRRNRSRVTGRIKP